MKKLLMVFLLGVFSLPELKAAEAGRYQITSSMSGVYFLDTATGELWRRSKDGGWVKVDSPVNKVAGVPDIKLRPVTIELPAGGRKMTVIQREARDVVGSKGSLQVRIGDISAGQALVEVHDKNGIMFLDRSTVKDGEFVSFEVKGKKVYLQMTEVVNKLIGNDYCELKFSFEKPVKTPE